MRNLRPAINCSNCKHVVVMARRWDDSLEYVCNVTKPTFLSVDRAKNVAKYTVSSYQVCDLHEPKEQKK